MKTILRKTLSLFLAFAMLAAVLPAITPAAEATGTDVVESFKYDWTAAGVAENEIGVTIKIRDNSADQEFADTWKDYNSTRNWAYISHCPSISPNFLKYVYIYPNEDTSNYTALGFGLVSARISSGSTEAWAAFKVKVPAAGTYSISGEFTSQTNVDLDIYMAPYTDDLAANAANVITDGNLVGTMAVADMVATGTDLKTGAIDAYTFDQSGDYIMVVKYNHVAGEYSYLYMRSLTFNREVMREYSWKVGTTDITNAQHKWGTGDAEYFSSYNEDAGRYWAFIEETLSYSNGGVSQSTNFAYLYAKNPNEYTALKINVPEKGKYDASLDVYKTNTLGYMNFYIIPYSETVKSNIPSYLLSKYQIGKDVSCVLSEDTTLTSDGVAQAWNGTVEFDKGGDYILVFEASKANSNGGSSQYYGSISSLTIKKTGEAAAAETQDVSGADILGEYYAYVNDGKLNLYGGVKKLAGYTKVGFEINDGSGWKAISEGTNNVYATLKGTDGRSVGVTAFGDSCKYVFADSTEEVSGDISVRAYAVSVDGDTVYGYVYTVTIG